MRYLAGVIDEFEADAAAKVGESLAGVQKGSLNVDS